MKRLLLLACIVVLTASLFAAGCGNSYGDVAGTYVCTADGSSITLKSDGTLLYKPIFGQDYESPGTYEVKGNTITATFTIGTERWTIRERTDSTGTLHIITTSGGTQFVKI